MRVVFHGVANNVGDFVVAAVFHFAHGVQNAALYRFEAIVQTRDSALQDDITGIIQKPVLVEAVEWYDFVVHVLLFKWIMPAFFLWHLVFDFVFCHIKMLIRWSRLLLGCLPMGFREGLFRRASCRWWNLDALGYFSPWNKIKWSR